MENIFYFALPSIAIIFFVFLLSTFTVKQHTAVIIERFGKFQNVRHAGLQFKIPFIDKVAEKFSLKIQQLDVHIETKTKENIFVTLTISVQFKVSKDNVYDAYYNMENPYEQISAYVTNIVRAEIPKLNLDEVFENKDEIAVIVNDSLSEKINAFGYDVINTLTTDVDPDIHVKNAMNRINAADLEKSAAEYEAETLQINILAKARAESESRRLESQWVANQRLEVAKSLTESLNLLGKSGINSTEASALLMITQHYDTLQSMSNNGAPVSMPTSPQESKEMINKMMAESFTKSEKTNEVTQDDSRKIIKFPNQKEEKDLGFYSNQL
ncbi:MAG: SPFH domain-containing protein [Flavobacterium sp. MedPE-SWcel]|uniref:SPFH domain-containing protein n=1 Tax=uncultured Flavobacterium sp. TaxID=165435 RepID=UPI000923684A|nr:SPFH domain-containing protein [uncultured Flavobacterium sp.]OIQ15578.1 MAG: SPFH domain-containing protein [Flavobacterium sp. MedPE-SWcel]